MLLSKKCLPTDSIYNLCLGVAKESGIINTKSPSVEYLAEIKLETDDFQGSMVDVSEQIENRSDSSELSQHVDKFGENLSGTYCY